MNTLITNPIQHRAAWARRHPGSLIENGGLLSASDILRFACDICMAPLDPAKPILAIGGPEGHSVCGACAALHKTEPAMP